MVFANLFVTGVFCFFFFGIPDRELGICQHRRYGPSLTYRQTLPLTYFVLDVLLSCWSGFGLLEVLEFCEDLNMEFIASIWWVESNDSNVQFTSPPSKILQLISLAKIPRAGLSLSPFKAVPEKEIDRYIQEAIDMVGITSDYFLLMTPLVLIL